MEKYVKPANVVRIDIKAGKGSKTLTVKEQDPQKVIDWITDQFRGMTKELRIPVLEKLKGVTVTCYAARGDTKFKSKSMTIYGLSPKEIYEILLLNL